jgi:hypothetical protein
MGEGQDDLGHYQGRKGIRRKQQWDRKPRSQRHSEYVVLSAFQPKVKIEQDGRMQTPDVPLGPDTWL